MASGTRTLCTRWYYLHSLLLFFLRVWWMEACLLFQHQTCAHLIKKKKSQHALHFTGASLLVIKASPRVWHRLAALWLFNGWNKRWSCRMWRHSQLNQCVQFSFYVNRGAYKSARLNKLIIFLCNTVNILNLEYYKNCPSGIKKNILIIHYCKIWNKSSRQSTFVVSKPLYLKISTKFCAVTK